MQAFVACQPTLKNKFAVYLRNKLFNFSLISSLVSKKSLDFIGLNYYSRRLVETSSWGIKHLLLDDCKNNHHPVKKNSLGWDIYPEGLYALLIKLKRYGLAVFIMENGICTEDDNLRWEYIYAHLKNTQGAISAGVKVMGYFYWSLMDNYEWDKGFVPRFGIIDIDYLSGERRARASAVKFAAVCKTGVLA
jgi:beta-glucosidase